MIEIDPDAASAIGLNPDAVRAMSLRQFIEHCTGRGIDVDVSMHPTPTGEPGKLRIIQKRQHPIAPPGDPA